MFRLVQSGTCEICGAERPWLHKHHLKPQVEGGTDDDGVVFICASCHEDVHGGPYGGILKGRTSASPESLEKRSKTMLAKWDDPAYRDKQTVSRAIAGAKRSNRPPRDELERLYRELKSQQAVADHLGTAQGNVSLWMNEYGLETKGVGRRRTKILTKEDIVAALGDAGSLNGAAKLLEVSRGTVRARMDELGIGIPVRPEPSRKEKSQNRIEREAKSDRLTEEFLRHEYLELKKSDLTIAKEVGVSNGLVFKRRRMYGIPSRPAGGAPGRGRPKK